MWAAAISNTSAGLHPGVDRLLGEMEIDWIFHCGNIGSNDVLVALSAHAPTTGVLGPKDDASELPFRGHLVKTIEGCTIYVAEDIGTAIRPNDATARAIEAHSPKVVLFAGSGAPSVDIVGGVIWVSPGSSQSEGDECAVAILELRGGQAHCEMVSVSAG
jgi:predicted phosphodiesterase